MSTEYKQPPLCLWGRWPRMERCYRVRASPSSPRGQGAVSSCSHHVPHPTTSVAQRSSAWSQLRTRKLTVIYLLGGKASFPNCPPQSAYASDAHCSSLQSPELQRFCRAEGTTAAESLSSRGSDDAPCRQLFPFYLQRHRESWHFPGSSQKEGRASDGIINHSHRQIREVSKTSLNYRL